MVSSGVIQSTFGWKQGDSPCYFFKGQEPGHDAGDRFYKAIASMESPALCSKTFSIPEPCHLPLSLWPQTQELIPNIHNIPNIRLWTYEKLYSTSTLPSGLLGKNLTKESNVRFNFMFCTCIHILKYVIKGSSWAREDIE